MVIYRDRYRMVVPKGQGKREWERLWNGCRVSVWDDEQGLEMVAVVIV